MNLCAHKIGLLLCSGLAMAAQAATNPLAYENQTLALDGQQVQARVPKGYRLELLTGALDGPRLLTFAPNGDLFIGSKSGKVYRLAPPYTTPQVLVTLDGYPHSVAFRKDEILIARTDGVYRAPYKPGQAKLAPAAVTLLAALPGGGGHNSRTVGVGPDGRVYASLGIQGNCSDQYIGEGYAFDDRRGGILVLRDDKHWEPYGSGLRNPVGFAWHPRDVRQQQWPRSLGLRAAAGIFQPHRARLISRHAVVPVRWQSINARRLRQARTATAAGSSGGAGRDLPGA